MSSTPHAAATPAAPDTDGTRQRRALARTFALGVLLQVLLAIHERFLNVTFPINLIGTLLLAAALSGAGIGALASAWGNRHRRAVELATGAAALAYLLAIATNRNVSVHFLLSDMYYPYPKPADTPLRMLALGSAFVLCGVLVGVLSGAVARRLASAERAGPTLVSWLGGLVSGAWIAWLGVQAAGPYRLAMVWAAALALLATSVPRRVLLVAAVAVIATWSEGTRFLPYLWRTPTWEAVSRHWTPYYKLDFVRFHDDRCLGGVYNNLMLWYACPDATLLPMEIGLVMRAVGAPDQDVLVVGRTDGMYLGQLERWYGPPRSSLSLEYDPVVVEQVTGRYASFFSDRFSRPNERAVAGDLRRLVAEDDGRYDLVFLNGQMIRLYGPPHTLIPQEDYLFDRDTLTRLADHLRPGGMLVIDWGSSQESELYDVVSNLPAGMHATAFWTTISNQPMSGLPLFFLFASEDAARVRQVIADLESLGLDPNRSRTMDASLAGALPSDAAAQPTAGDRGEPAYDEAYDEAYDAGEGRDDARVATSNDPGEQRMAFAPGRLTPPDDDDRPFLHRGWNLGFAVLTLVPAGWLALVTMVAGGQRLGARRLRQRLTLGAVALAALLATLVGMPAHHAALAALAIAVTSLACLGLLTGLERARRDAAARRRAGWAAVPVALLALAGTSNAGLHAGEALASSLVAGSAAAWWVLRLHAGVRPVPVYLPAPQRTFLWTGITFGLVETTVLGRYAWALGTGAPLGAVLLWPVAIGAYALSFWLVERGPRDRHGVVAAAAALGAVLAAALGTLAIASPPALVLASLAGGLASGALFAVALAGVPAADRAAAFGYERLGWVAGLLLFQGAVFLVGFRGLAVVTAVVAAWTARRLRRRSGTLAVRALGAGDLATPAPAA